ncbi:MAG: hypothetical protein WD066_09255 [Planctomycetaceae bacterium]
MNTESLTRRLVFQGSESTWWVVLCLAAAIAAAGLIVTLMRYERKLVPKSTGYVLLGLRLSVLALLFVTLLQPELIWTLDRTRAGRTLVAIDLSESMSTADNHATPMEKLRWARALGMIGNQANAARLDRWAGELQAGKPLADLSWVDDGEAAEHEARRVLAEARRGNLEGIFTELDHLSRREIAQRLLTQTAAPLLKELEELGPVDVIAFAGGFEATDAARLGAFVATPPEGVDAAVTDLSQPLAATAAASEQGPLMGVVLFSDGRDNAGKLDALTIERLRSVGAPFFPVLLGSEQQPRDLAIAGLEFPRKPLYKGDKAIVTASLNTAGFEGERIEIHLEAEGDEPRSKTVEITGPQATVRFELDSGELGRKEYTVRAENLPGETRDDNNQQGFALNVIDDRVRVLLVEGEARWEFRFIDNALTRDERVTVDRVVHEQPYIGLLQQPFFPTKLELPGDPDELAGSPFAEPDLVIIGDVAPHEMPEEAWRLLDKYVADAGGTLVLLAGKRHFPLAYRSEVVDRLVPVVNLRPLDIGGRQAIAAPTERGFRLEPTADGLRQEMLQLDPEEERNRRIWGEFPGHMWGLLGEAKRGATVLARAVEVGQGGALDDERRSAVIVHQQYGLGQVLWLGIDSTWRWRHRAGDEHHHRFWAQIGRWAAESKASATSEHVRLVVARTDIEEGEDAVIEARFTRDLERRHPRAKATAVLRRADADPNDPPFQTLELAPVAHKPLSREGRAVSLAAGTYKVELLIEGANGAGKELSSFLYVHRRQTAELSDLSANRDLLMQFGIASGGRMFYPDELARLPPLLRSPELTQTLREETPLWDHWTLMLVFFGLLTIEWVVRKLNGLP